MNNNIELIPAIDLIQGQCVRLSQGDFEQCIAYPTSPLAMAKRFREAGYRRLHLVDLDGARQGHPVNMDVLTEIANETDLIIDYGGGVKTTADIESIFQAGAAMVCIGSMAVREIKQCQEWSDQFGVDRLLFGVDSYQGKVCIDAWKTVTEYTVEDIVESYGSAMRHLMCTDISVDGMMQGINPDFYEALTCRFPHLNIIASGGVSTSTDLLRLQTVGIKQAIVGKAFYEGIFKL